MAERAATMILLLAALLQAEPVWVGRFSGNGEIPAPWHVVQFGKTKPTIYSSTIVADVSAIEARVDSSMAVLARPIDVDLAQTPILCWRWFVQGVVANADMQKKSGNDFAARVYVGFDMPSTALGPMTKMKLAFARAVYGRDVPDAAIIYVWDNQNPVGLAQKSPYSKQMQMIVARSGNALAGAWVTERFDLAADFARSFDGKPGRPVQIAIASDGDNTKSSGLAAFADIHFVRQDQACLN